MRECFRIFRLRNLVLLLVLCMINIGIFVLCADPNKDITLQGEELEEYLADYPAYIERTTAQADKLSMLSVYKTGFSAEKVSKSRAAYEELKNVKVAAGDNRGTALLIEYRLTDIFLMVFLFLLVMDFGVERKKGLSGIVRSTRKGRSILYCQRVLWLAVGTVLATVLLYGSVFFSAKFTLGLDDLNRSIQSLPEFARCTKTVSIWQLMLQVCIRKAMAAYFAGMLLYLLMGIWSEGIAVVGTVILFAEQFITATFITPVSALNALRYVNLYTLLRGVDFYENSIYLNFLGHAVEGENLAQKFLLVGLPVLLVLGAFLYGFGYLQNSRLGERLVDAVMHLRERLAVAHTLTVWESYKLFIRQKGLLFLGAVLMLQFLLAYQYDYYYPVNTFEQLYYLKYHGPLTEESYAKVLKEKQFLVDAEQRLMASEAEIEAKTPINYERLRNVSALLYENRQQQKNLAPVLENMQEGMAYTERTGNEIELVEPFSYDLLLRMDVRTRKRAAFLELIGILGTIAGLYALEKQNHMEQLLRYSYKGRVQEWGIKPALACVFCGLMGMGVHLIQFVHIASSRGFPDLQAPVQSIRFMREFPIFISIRGFFILLFVVRGLLAMVVGIIVGMISKLCPNYITALGVAFFLVVLLIAVSTLTGVEDWNLISLLSGEFMV